MSLGITVQHCSVSLIAEDRRFAVGLSSARARRRHADLPRDRERSTPQALRK